MLNAGDFLQNRYEIINCIGSGGMADVFRARDHKLNRFVAIKVLKAEFRSDKDFVSKFRVEAQAAAGLAHPNIVNVYDVGDENGIYFIVMELVEGITLKTYILSKGKLSVREATGISLQVASGLEAAHNNEIIHRDVKPQNIIISTDGTAKVADFGIARAASSDTINSNVMGSVHYSAPEQSRGGYSDAKSDIYSLGITMYEMLTGRVPFDGDSTVEIALKHLHEEIISPREYVPDLPRAIEQIILKCTQKSPDRRYQSMSLLIRDLKESLVNPNGDFVRIASENPVGATHKYSKKDLEEINRRSQEGDAWPGLFEGSYDGRMNYPPEDEPLDDDEYYGGYPDEFDQDEIDEPKKRGMRKGGRNSGSGGSGSEKFVMVISIVVAVAIGLLILYLILHTFDVFGPGGSRNMTEAHSSGSSNSASEQTAVPDLLGKTENEAQAALKEKGLGYKYLGETSSNDYAAGQIAEQDTDPGTMVDKNTRIGYMISIGSAQALTVPDLTNKLQADAEQAIISMGLVPYVDNTRYSDTVEAGHVITTNPGAGSSVHEGETISLYISQGQDSQSVKVPDVQGKYKEDAVTMLTNSGLYVYVASASSDTVPQNLVIRQDPAPDSSVQTGSSITITVSTGPENPVVVNPDQTFDVNTQSADSTWMCYAQLQAPADYIEGSYVRITLSQNGSEKNVFDGTTSFPYLLNTEGIPGVSTGTAFVYMYDNYGNPLSTTRYDGIEFYEQ